MDTRHNPFRFSLCFCVFQVFSNFSLSQLFYFFLHNKMYTEPLRQVAVRSYAATGWCHFKLLLPNWVPLLKVQNSTIFCWIASQKESLFLLYIRETLLIYRESFILMTEAPGFLQGTRILTVGFDRIFYPAIRDNSISARKSVIFVVKEGRYMIMKDRLL